MKIRFVDANESVLLAPYLSVMIAEALFQKMKREESLNDEDQGEICRRKQFSGCDGASDRTDGAGDVESVAQG